MQHPEIEGSNIKEPAFFSRFYNEGLDWYRDLYKSHGNVKYLMDFSVNYMISEETVERIYKTLGNNAKFIFMLRNPADRAYSDYWMSRKFGKEESVEIEEAFRRDYEISLKEPANSNYYLSGLYGEHIEYFFKRFKRGNLHFIIFSEFIENPEKSCKDVFEFLGLDAVSDIDYGVWKNKASKSKRTVVSRVFKSVIKLIPMFIKRGIRPGFKFKIVRVVRRKQYKKREVISYKTDPDVCKWILDLYKDDIAKLEKLIGRDLSMWREKYNN